MDWIEKKNEKKANVEGSASNPLWDDEDSEDFDGSGSGMPPVIDRNPVKAIIQEDHPKNIGKLEIKPQMLESWYNRAVVKNGKSA